MHANSVKYHYVMNNKYLLHCIIYKKLKQNISRCWIINNLLFFRCKINNLLYSTFQLTVYIKVSLKWDPDEIILSELVRGRDKWPSRGIILLLFKKKYREARKKRVNSEYEALWTLAHPSFSHIQILSFSLSIYFYHTVFSLYLALFMKL